MRQNYGQHQKQQQTLSPQQAQLFKMIGMSAAEMRDYLQEELDLNPALEGVIGPENVSLNAPAPDVPRCSESEREDEEFQDYLLQDSGDGMGDNESKYQFMIDSIEDHSVSLEEHLLAQLQLCDLSQNDRTAAEMLIGEIDDNGYFKGSLPDLQMASGRTEEDLLKLLTLIQTFDPPGVGARTVQECLLLQLKEDDKLLRLFVSKYLLRIMTESTRTLARKMKTEPEVVERLLEAVRKLNPKPGEAFSRPPVPYVTPEMSLVLREGVPKVELDNDQMPNIRISSAFQKALANPNLKEDERVLITSQIKNANLIVMNIEKRKQTIRAVAQAIVDVQKDYLLKKTDALKPLTQQEIAERVEIHSATVSRTVNGKYIRTPRGVVELASLFMTGGFQNVEDLIKDFIASEDPRKPVSDSDVAKHLQDHGFEIARTTVVKYRTRLGIPSSKERFRK